MFEVLAWYLATLAVGVAGLLPSTLLFTRLRSRGVLYARPIAFVLVAQAAWLTAALTSASYGVGLIALALAALYAWSAWLVWRDQTRLDVLLDRKGTLLAGEALFLAVFVLLAVVRAQAPAAIATEKPMDLMLLNAVHHAADMPPPDAWLAGFDISYYHLGHVMVDVAQQLTSIGPGYGFNLGLAAAGAMVAATTAGLAIDAVGLGRPRRRSTVWIAAALAVVGVVWLAPLEGLAELAAANGIGGPGFWGTLGVAGLPGPAEATHGVPRRVLVVVARNARRARHDQRVPGVLTDSSATSTPTCSRCRSAWSPSRSPSTPSRAGRRSRGVAGPASPARSSWRARSSPGSR